MKPKAPYIYKNTDASNPALKVPGISVEVRGEYQSDREFNKALRIFSKKVQEAGIIREIRAREFYEKPTAKRKRKAQLARKRWLKKVADTGLPVRETRGRRHES